MSSQTVQSDIGIDREREDVLSDAHSYLQNEYDELYAKRYRGFYHTQSLRELRESVDDEAIVEIEARRSAEEGESRIDDCPHFPIQMNRRVDARLRYNEFTADEQLNTGRVISAVETYGLDDVCVSDVVIKFRDDELYESLCGMLRSIGGHSIDLSDFKQPFVMVMSGNVPNTEDVYEKVKENHPQKYWSPDGLNWDVRSLDVEKLWTIDAYRDEDIMAGLYNGIPISLKQLERYAFNEVGVESPQYGVTSSAYFLDTIRDQFVDGTMGRKRWDWETSGDWTQNGRSI